VPRKKIPLDFGDIPDQVTFWSG